MSRETFHESLERIEMELLSMGELASASVQSAVDALVQHDDAKAQGVIDDDDRVDEQYLRIDSEILSVLALQSPVAADLRLISAIMHSNLHLERVGDQAVNVAKLYLRTNDESGSQSMVMQLQEMGTIVVSMLRTAMEAFGRRDLGLAHEGARYG